MLIKGIQKTTLIDYPNEIACTIFLFGCNFRCNFCHNPELVIDSEGRIYSEQEILDFLSKRKKYLGGVCITGGEPLICLDLDFINKIKAMGYKVKIDTNGSFPDKLKLLINNNLVDYIAMDIKAGKEKYEEIVNRNIDLEKIQESIKIISNFKNHEFRTTILPKFHDEPEIRRMMEWLKSLIPTNNNSNNDNNNNQKFYLQGFKNNHKFVGQGFENEPDITEEYLITLKKVAEEYFDDVRVRV